MLLPQDRPDPVVSEKKRAANRANARKSTGPRTAAGKARVSLNALTHGLTAAAAALPTENQDHFEKFAAALRAELKPRGFLQTLIGERLIEVAWKQRRAARAITEHACRRLDHDLHGWERARKLGAWTGPDLVLTGTEMLVDSAEGGKEAAAFLRLELYADRMQRAFHQGLTQLRREQRRAAQEAGGDASGDNPAADVEVALEGDPLENARFGNKATAEADADGKPEDLRNYWVDISARDALSRQKERENANSQNKATAAREDAAARESEPVAKPSAKAADPHENLPPSPGLRRAQSSRTPGEEETPSDLAAPVEAAPVDAAEGKPSGVALTRDVGMSSSGEQPGEIDPWRQVPPSHPFYRGPQRAGG